MYYSIALGHYRGVIAFTALGNKLLLSLAVLVLMFLYSFPKGNGTDSLLPGWVGSLAMRPASSGLWRYKQSPDKADGSPQSAVQFSPPGLTHGLHMLCRTAALGYIFAVTPPSFLLRLCCGSTDDFKFVSTSFTVGQNVALTCPRQKSLLHQETLYWIRLVSGNWPEFLGATYNFDDKFDDVNQIPHITAKQGDETFILHFNGAKLNDTGLYYCFKIKQLYMTFLYGTFLKIKEPEPDITAVIQEPPSDPVHPGDPVTLLCSVLFKSEKKACSADHSVYWFRAGSDESHPGLLYAHENSGDGCERVPETDSTQKCVYSHSRSVSSSDVGTYYCAVAACGEILFGNGAKLDIEGTDMWSQGVNAVIFLFCAALTLGLIVIAVLIYAIKKNKCDCCNAAVSQHINNRVPKNLQSVEDNWVYSAVFYTMMNADGGAIKDANAEREKIYAAVKALGPTPPFAKVQAHKEKMESMSMV
ncbi:uncharacterized protein LOC142397186 [Odontesthes bonariensis]|uniref:uncharacterized protein LOC142397186 n=1 Tax=Odontesthes bonariensis TaxID=219752 RepID=UPI003F580FF9